jgi:hypothetical protein
LKNWKRRSGAIILVRLRLRSRKRPTTCQNKTWSFKAPDEEENWGTHLVLRFPRLAERRLKNFLHRRIERIQGATSYAIEKISGSEAAIQAFVSMSSR